jgi:hypothetical protein
MAADAADVATPKVGVRNEVAMHGARLAVARVAN